MTFGFSNAARVIHLNDVTGPPDYTYMPPGRPTLSDRFTWIGWFSRNVKPSIPCY